MSLKNIKLVEIEDITGKILVKTGLHIGGNYDFIEIGGVDSIVIKNPFTGEPYIPGSSIKGRMRALLELMLNKVIDGKVHQCKSTAEALNCPICRVFGTSASDIEIGPTRLIVNDAHLSEDFKKEIRKAGRTLSEAIFEVKYENTIDRISARANPRSIERVVPGTVFDFKMQYMIFDFENSNGKSDREFLPYVFAGLKLIELTYLGGNGSRGYGKVKFQDIKMNGEPVNIDEYYQKVINQK